MASKSIKAAILIGGTVSGSLRSALGSTQKGLAKIGDAIATVERKQRLMAQSIDVFGRAGKNVDRLRAKYGELTREADRLRVAQTRLAVATARVKANDDRRAELGGAFRGSAATMGVAVGGAAFVVREAVQFENAMLGVAKQVQGARDAGGKLTPVYQAMRREIQNLGHEIPIATNEIAGMVAAGARMGVARKDLIGFVRTAAMMADAFEMPSEQLADDMGKIAGLFAIPIPRIGDLADAINYLDDNSKSSGGEIIDVLRRIGGMAQTLRMPAKEAAALGSTFLTLGSTAEVAGTASNAVMRILGAATAQSKRVQVGLKSISIDPIAIQANMAKDPTGTILSVLDALNKLNGEQRMVAATRIFGAEYGDDIAKLAVGAAEYRKQLALVNSETAKGSMSREFNARLQTTGAQWQLAKNGATALAVNIGTALLPAVNSLMGATAPMVSAFATFAEKNPTVIKGVVGLAIGLTGLRMATVGAQLAWTTAARPILGGMKKIAEWRAAGAMGQLGRFGSIALRVGNVIRTAVMGIAALGGGPVALIVGALVVGALVVRKYWQPISAFLGGMFEGVAGVARQAFGELRAAAAPLQPVFAAIGSAIGGVVRWFVNLLAPVQSTQTQLAGAASAGRTFGAILGQSLMTGVRVATFLVRAIGVVVTAHVKAGAAIRSAFGSAFDAVRNIVGAAVDWIAARIAPVASVIGGIKAGASRVMGMVMPTPTAAPVAAPAAPVAAPRAGAPALRIVPPAPRPLGARVAPTATAPARSAPGPVPVAQRPAPAAPGAPVAVRLAVSNPAPVRAAAARPAPAPALRAVPAPKPVAAPPVARATPVAKAAKPAAAPVAVKVAVSNPPPPAAPRAKQPPPVKAAPAKGRSVAAAAPSGGHTFNIYQQPGESADAVADRVIAKIDSRGRAKSRGRLEDEAA